MTYYEAYENDASGEIKMWHACFIQHIVDLLYSHDIKIIRNAQSFLFGSDQLFTDICLLINQDVNILRKNILKLYKQQKKINLEKKLSVNITKNLMKKLLQNLQKICYMRNLPIFR